MPQASNGAASEQTGGSAIRTYVVLEEVRFEGEETAYYSVATEVAARNGAGAMRGAYKELRAARGEDFDEVIFAVVPAGQWRPTPVHTNRKESISITVG